MKNVTEIKIDDEARNRLQAARDGLQAAFDAHKEANGQLDKLKTKRDSVADAIEFGRPNVFDDAAVEKFSAKKTQLALLDTELAKARAALGPIGKEIDRQARGAASALRDSVQSFYQECLAEAAKAFEPYYESPQRARYAARNCDQLTAMSNRLSMLRGEPGTAGDVLERINKTLDGDASWLTGNGAK